MARLRPVLDRARGERATVHLDTEHDDAKDLGYELLRRMGSEYPDVQLGCVVQAYRRDSYADLLRPGRVVGGRAPRPLRVRLVKGAYWDPETIVARPRGGRRRCSRARPRPTPTSSAAAVRGRRTPARSAPRSRATTSAASPTRSSSRGPAVSTPTALELQLLYGMAEPVHAALARAGHRVRVYAPVGELVPGIAYLVRRLLENTSNESFVRRRFAEGHDLDELDPRARGRRVDSRMRRRQPIPPAAAGHVPPPFANEPHAELRRAAPRAGSRPRHR